MHAPLDPGGAAVGFTETAIDPRTGTQAKSAAGAEGSTQRGRGTLVTHRRAWPRRCVGAAAWMAEAGGTSVTQGHSSTPGSGRLRQGFRGDVPMTYGEEGEEELVAFNVGMGAPGEFLLLQHEHELRSFGRGISTGSESGGQGKGGARAGQGRCKGGARRGRGKGGSRAGQGRLKGGSRAGQGWGKGQGQGKGGAKGSSRAPARPGRGRRRRGRRASTCCSP